MSKSMMLIGSEWNQQSTFKLIPISLDCPYNEAIFDPAQKILAIVSKEKKETFHFLPRLNENGDVVMIKNGKRQGGQPYAEQRVNVETYYEYFIRQQSDIEQFVARFAENSEFDFKEFLSKAFEQQPSLDLAAEKAVV